MSVVHILISQEVIEGDQFRYFNWMLVKTFIECIRELRKMIQKLFYCIIQKAIRFLSLCLQLKKKKKKGLKIFNVNYTHISIIEFIYEKITL